MELEKYGITFLRFTDIDVKKNMFSVLLCIEQTIDSMLDSTKN